MAAPKITLQAYPVKVGKLVKTEDARDALMAAVRAIPLERLNNLRSAMITVAM